MTHEAETHAHPIRDVLAVLRRHGRLPTARPRRSVGSSRFRLRNTRRRSSGKDSSPRRTSPRRSPSTPACPARRSTRRISAPEVVTGILPAPYARKNAICALSRDGIRSPWRSRPLPPGRDQGARAHARDRGAGRRGDEVRDQRGQRSLYNLKTSLVAAATELEDESAGIPDAPAGSWELVSAADDESDLTPTTRPVVSALDSILRQALEHRASDIHMEPKARPRRGPLPGGRRAARHAPLPPHRLSGRGEADSRC